MNRKRISPVLLLSSLLVSLLVTASHAETVVYVSEGGDQRIAVYSLDEETGGLTRASEIELPGAPGCLAVNRDRDRLHASVRTVPAFASMAIGPDRGALEMLAEVAAPGSAAYVYLDATEQWLLSACYREGFVGVTAIVDGVVSGDPQSVLGAGPKAHCIQTDPGNRFAFVPHPVDLNQVTQIRFDAENGELRWNKPSLMKGAEGAGPRHIQFHPNGKWAYLVNEQGKSVSHCEYDAEAGNLTLRGTISTVPADWNPDEGSCADIEISADGRFVYASNRGHDSIAIFSIDETSGELTSLGQEPTGAVPRSFNLIEGGETFLVAAGQKSNDLTVYRRDVESGLLEKLKTYATGKSPSWVVGVKLGGSQ